MKTRHFPRSLAALAGLALLGQFAVAMAAVEAATTPANPLTEKAVPSPATPVQLSHGVPDVLKLSRAKIKDETILAFVSNSQSNYNLSAEEIIYLRAEGVSERVVASMLEHNKKGVATQTAPAAPTPNHSTVQAAAQPAPAAVQAAPTYVPAANAYVQPAPVYVQSSPVYVYSSSTYSDYDYYPYSYSYYGGYRGYSSQYYGGYVGYGYPAVSLGFSFGGGHRGGGHSGGHHGGRR